MKRIFLLRHAEPELGGRQHVCLGGRSDVPLSEEGKAHAAAAAACFDSGKSFRVYSSPMLRARQTAELISAGRWETAVLPGMEEIDCGQWDGLTFDEIRQRYPELYAARGGNLSLTPPGGESLEKLACRGLAALEKLKSDETDDIILVAHKGINRVLICALTGRELAEYRSLEQDYLSINCLELSDGKLKVDSVGCSPEDFRY